MILDEHTPCPACPQVVRDLVVATRRLLSVSVTPLADGDRFPAAAEFLVALDALTVWVDAHHANQLHSHSLELEDARAPHLTAVAVDHEGSSR